MSALVDAGCLSCSGSGRVGGVRCPCVARCESCGCEVATDHDSDGERVRVLCSDPACAETLVSAAAEQILVRAHCWGYSDAHEKTPGVGELVDAGLAEWRRGVGGGTALRLTDEGKALAETLGEQQVAS